MIFRNKDMKLDGNYLFVDDILDTDIDPIEKESLENMPIPKRGKIVIGTFGAFGIKEFGKAVGGLKNV